MPKPKRWVSILIVPTVLRAEGFEFRIWTNDHEPPHVHVFRSGAQVKVELISAQAVRVWGMRPRDVRLAEELVAKNRTFLLEAWGNIHG